MMEMVGIGSSPVSGIILDFHDSLKKAVQAWRKSLYQARALDIEKTQ
jgi:hypothetical protein